MEKFSGTKSVFLIWFYILCESFSKIGPIIKKIPKFWDDPLNGCAFAFHSDTRNCFSFCSPWQLMNFFNIICLSHFFQNKRPSISSKKWLSSTLSWRKRLCPGLSTSRKLKDARKRFPTWTRSSSTSVPKTLLSCANCRCELFQRVDDVGSYLLMYWLLISTCG